MDKQLVLAVVLAVAFSAIISAILCAGLGMHEENKLNELSKKIQENITKQTSAAIKEIEEKKTSIETNISMIKSAQQQALQAIREAKNKALNEINNAEKKAVENIKAQIQVLIATLKEQNISTIIREVTSQPSKSRVYHIVFNMTPDFGLRITDKPANATIALLINDVLVFNKTFHWPSVLYEHYPPYIANITLVAPYVAKVTMIVDAQLGKDEHISMNTTAVNPYPPSVTKLVIRAVPHLAPVIRHITLQIQEAS